MSWHQPSASFSLRRRTAVAADGWFRYFGGEKVKTPISVAGLSDWGREVMGGVRPKEWVFELFIIMRNFCH